MTFFFSDDPISHQTFADVDLLLIKDGVDSEDVLKIKTVALQ